MPKTRHYIKTSIAIAVALLLALSFLSSCVDSASTDEPEEEVKGSMGYIDEQGNWVIEPQFDSGSRFNGAGYARASAPKTRLFGVIDNTGEWVIEPQFKSPFEFVDDDLIFAKDPSTGLSGIS